jgi:hypothetical protein
MNPVEEFLEMKKEAVGPAAAGFFGRAMGAAGRAVGKAQQNPAAWGALSALGVGGTYAGAVGAEKLYLAATKGRDFKQMMQANPHLEPYRAENPQEFNRMFTALRSMNPDFSQEPMVAGAYMHRAMETPVEDRGMVAVEALQGLRQRPTTAPVQTGALAGGALARGMGGPLKPPEPERPVQVGKKTVTERWIPDDPAHPEGPGGFKKVEIRQEEPEYGDLAPPTSPRS